MYGAVAIPLYGDVKRRILATEVSPVGLVVPGPESVITKICFLELYL